MIVPTRYSKEWWAWIFSAAIMCGTLVVLAAHFTGKLSNDQFIWAFVIGAVVGDFCLAFGMEAVAPTRVTVGPGEKLRNDSPLCERAKVISEFSAEGQGKISVRGEIWNARCSSPTELEPTLGQEVIITGRDGLTLLVDVCTNDT